MPGCAAAALLAVGGGGFCLAIGASDGRARAEARLGPHDGRARLWMTPLTLGRVVLLGVVVYLAVRLAGRDSRASKPDARPSPRV